MCNIAGYSGQKPPSIDKLKILFALGRSRGTDSCGIVINNKRTLGYPDKEIGNLKKNLSDPLDFLGNFQFPKNFNTNTVIMHSRRGTTGGKNARTAHPYEFEYEDGTKLYFMHNGTIYNEREIREKYDIKYADHKTDTELMGLVLYHHGMEKFIEMLKMYRGAANLVWYWSDQPDEMWIWKGASMDSYHNKQENKKKEYLAEDRPLYFWSTKHGFYFNSERQPLDIISNLGNVQRLKTNTVMKFRKGFLAEEIKVDRKLPRQTSYQSNFSIKPKKTVNTGGNKGFTPTNPQNEAKGDIYWFNGLYYRNGITLTGVYYYNKKSKLVNIPLDQLEKAPKDTELLFFIHGFWLKDEDSYRQNIGNSTDPVRVYYHDESFHERFGYYYDGAAALETMDKMKFHKRFMYYEYTVEFHKIIAQKKPAAVVPFIPKIINKASNLQKLNQISFFGDDNKTLEIDFKAKTEPAELITNCINDYNNRANTAFYLIDEVNAHYNRVNKSKDVKIIEAGLENFEVYTYNYLHGTSFLTDAQMIKHSTDTYGKQINLETSL